MGRSHVSATKVAHRVIAYEEQLYGQVLAMTAQYRCCASERLEPDEAFASAVRVD